MFGQYEHFPKTVHGSAFFSTLTSTKTTQQTLVNVLCSINRERLKFEDITDSIAENCTVIFEFGIADGNGFTYLNAEETTKTLKAIRGTPLRTLDFLCDARYYRDPDIKKTALRFDYYMLRFVFDLQQLEMVISHEKGPRRISPEELIQFVAGRINTMSSRRILKRLA